MKFKSAYLICSLCILPVILMLAIIAQGNGAKKYSPYEKSWSKQLNEMNYLIMRTSSINIVNGLWLTEEQASKLQVLCKKIDKTNPPIPDMRGAASKDLIKVRQAYIKVIPYLIKRKKAPERLKNEMNTLRILEADIIKKSIAGSQMSRYQREGCLKCHASPKHFPKKHISKINLRKINAKERKAIDLAHVKGMFGHRGFYKLWELKSEVDAVLSSGQRYLLKNFNCCIFPPENLSNPTNIGQAFVSDQWIEYFRSIRKVPGSEWSNVKSLFIDPIDTLIEATLPGIQRREKKKMLAKVDALIEKSRKLDDIDFELKKEKLCEELKDALNINAVVRETVQQKEIRQFTASMFLLFPGNDEVYSEVIRKIQSEK